MLYTPSNPGVGWRGGGGGVLRISSCRVVGRIFFRFEIFDFGIFLGRKILSGYFLGLLDLSRDFFFSGIQGNLKIRYSSHISRPRSSANKFLWHGNAA